MKTIKATGKTAKLINNGAQLDDELKLLKDELSEVKDDLGFLSAGKHVTSEGNSVTVSETDVFSEISPESAKMALREKRLGKNFLDCVKVAITPLKRYLSDQELGTLRKVVKQSRRYTFK